MNVIWKRPDGFLGAAPEDYRVIEIADHSRLWLHKRDSDNFPFRVAGGWQEQEASKKLNNLVNRLNKPAPEWIEYLSSLYDHSMSDNADTFYVELSKWLGELKTVLKGDTWEVEIMDKTIEEVVQQLGGCKAAFLKANQ